MTANPPKVHRLMHPELGVPAEAAQLDYWYECGRARGLKLQFPDKIRCLTYAEIGRLMRAMPAVPAKGGDR